MLSFNPNKKDCTGCAACYSVCPVHCIEMMYDEEGFLYPLASDNCIKCNLCEKVCPIKNNNDVKNDFQKQAFAAVSKDFRIWKRSASGGAFSEICKSFGNENTIIAGASWNGFEVHHILVKGTENILPICKSKYISSSIDDTFIHIKEYLEKGEKAIFCGTPCQVAGLKSFLQKEYDNLLTVDLICHGVGSTKVFKSCIKILEKQFGKKIVSYQFRTKRKLFETDYLSKLSFENGKDEYVSNDIYNQIFLSQNCLRPSCGENCIFRNENRQGDITIADFKGLTEVFPNLKGTRKNYSSIIINSVKGNSLIDNLKENMELLSCSIDDIKKYNPLFYKQTWFSKDREAFFAEFIKSPEIAIEKWTKPTGKFQKSLKRKIFDILPDKIRKRIFTLINRGRQ